MDKEFVQVQIALGLLVGEVSQLKKVVEAQAKTIENLVDLSNKGKGAAWVLIGFGGIAGALAVKLIHLIPILGK